jgi:hypothetical protein
MTEEGMETNNPGMTAETNRNHHDCRNKKEHKQIEPIE